MTKAAVQIGRHSWLNTTSLGNKPICPQRRRKLPEMEKKELSILLKKMHMCLAAVGSVLLR